MQAVPSRATQREQSQRRKQKEHSVFVPRGQRRSEEAERAKRKKEELARVRSLIVERIGSPFLPAPSRQELAGFVGLSSREIDAAMRVVEKQGLACRMLIDTVVHWTLPGQEDSAVAELPIPFDSDLKALYAAFGTVIPEKIERRPSVNPLGGW